MPSEYKPSPNLSPPPNISPPNVLKNGYKPRAYIRDFTVCYSISPNLTGQLYLNTDRVFLVSRTEDGTYWSDKSSDFINLLS